jgi:hypothetical protein
MLEVTIQLILQLQYCTFMLNVTITHHHNLHLIWYAPQLQDLLVVGVWVTYRIHRLQSTADGLLMWTSSDGPSWWPCWIWGSHSGDYEKHGLLRVWHFGGTYRFHLHGPKPRALSKLHGTTTTKTTFFHNCLHHLEQQLHHSCQILHSREWQLYKALYNS